MYVFSNYALNNLWRMCVQSGQNSCRGFENWWLSSSKKWNWCSIDLSGERSARSRVSPSTTCWRASHDVSIPNAYQILV
jgi:hypothetical protein